MRKIFSFILNDQNQLLLLRNNPADKIHGGDFWYTVTGGIEKFDNTIEDAVIREIYEETNLSAEKVIYLNWVFKYTHNNIKCNEYVFIAFVKKEDIILNEENIEYKWCDLIDYIDMIWWYGKDKSKLAKVLDSAINGEIYFKSEEIN